MADTVTAENSCCEVVDVARFAAVRPEDESAEPSALPPYIKGGHVRK